jgi:hypothetical protein
MLCINLWLILYLAHVIELRCLLTDLADVFRLTHSFYLVFSSQTSLVLAAEPLVLQTGSEN